MELNNAKLFAKLAPDALNAVPDGETVVRVQLVDSGGAGHESPYTSEVAWKPGTVEVHVDTWGPSTREHRHLSAFSFKRWQFVRAGDAQVLTLITESGWMR